MTIPILNATQRWYCPNCAVVDVTLTKMPNRYHACAGLHGLLAPLLPVGVKAKVVAYEREDYVGTEDVRLTEGRPVMSVVTTRDDGQDVIVFAPTATASGESLGIHPSVGAGAAPALGTGEAKG